MACICLAGLLGHAPARAQLWIDAGDARTRHHLQQLADAGHINLPLTSWPLMWQGVRRALGDLDQSQLNATELQSFSYLRRESQKSQAPFTASQFFSINSSLPGLIDYATLSREQREIRTSLGYHNPRWAANLQASVIGDSLDGQTFRADGSYLAGTLGNWAVGVGAINRWWGPGWQSSLILSSAARPSPGVFLTRVETQAFELPLLKWLGPWDLTAFGNQLEGDRATPHAKLLGMRVSFKPLARLEIGLSRTAQWGGQGRPEDARSLWRTLVGQSNRGADGLAEDGSDEPANQLAGYDWRLSHNFAGAPSAFYGQLIGEDEAGGLPYKFLGLAGVETSVSFGGAHHRLALEASNTTMEFNQGGSPNVAYEHPRYPSGYRYRGRPLAASTDNDSELFTLKGLHQFEHGDQLAWSLGRGKINSDGRNLSAPGGNLLSAVAVDLWYAQARYDWRLSDKSTIGLGGQYYNNELAIRGQAIGSGLFMNYQLQWLH